MSRWSVLGLDCAQWLACRLGVERASDLGSWIGRTLGPRTGRHRRTLQNLSKALPASTAEVRESIARDMWASFGRTVAESLLIDKIAAAHDRVRIENPQVLSDDGDGHRGTVFVGLHFGNWEITALAAAEAGEKPLAVYKPLADTDADTWLRRQRASHYPGGLLPASRAALLTMARHVRAGGSVCLLGDHRDSAGVDVPFFGIDARSTMLPAMLAVRYHARLIAARVDRTGGTRFSVHLERVPVHPTGSEDADIHTATSDLQAVFQRWIEMRPAEWLWFYNRWGIGK